MEELRECEYGIFVPNVGICCKAYYTTDKGWLHFPVCTEPNCPLVHSELLDGTTLNGYEPQVIKHVSFVPILKGAHERMEQLDKLCGDLQKFQSEWISVEDRLPEKDGEVLVYNGKAVYTKMFMYPNEFTTFKKEPNFCYCDKSGDVWWIKSTDKITHWMPLPEAPKMKGSEE